MDDRTARLVATADAVLDRINQRFDRLEQELDRHFVWTMGTMMTGFIAVIAALIGVVYR